MCRNVAGLVWRSGGFRPVPVSYAPDFGPEEAGAERGDTEERHRQPGRPGRRGTDTGDSGEEELDMDELVGLTEEMAVNFSEEEDLSWVDD